MSPLSDARIERIAHSILSQPAYRYHGEALLQRALNRIGDWIGRFLSRLVTGHGGIDLALAIAVAAAIVAVAIMILVHVVRHRVPRTVEVRAPEARSLSAMDWLTRGDAAASAGRWDEALRCHYRATVAELARRGCLTDADGRTAGEQRATVVRTAPDAYDPFAELTGAFEGVWYAGHAAGEEDGRRSRHLYEDVSTRAP